MIVFWKNEGEKRRFLYIVNYNNKKIHSINISFNIKRNGLLVLLFLNISLYGQQEFGFIAESGLTRIGSDNTSIEDQKKKIGSNLAFGVIYQEFPADDFFLDMGLLYNYHSIKRDYGIIGPLSSVVAFGNQYEEHNLVVGVPLGIGVKINRLKFSGQIHFKYKLIGYYLRRSPITTGSSTVYTFHGGVQEKYSSWMLGWRGNCIYDLKGPWQTGLVYEMIFSSGMVTGRAHILNLSLRYQLKNYKKK